MSLNVTLLRESFQAIAPRADYLADRFYSQLFLDYPEQSARFQDTDFADQQQKLIGGLSAIVRQLDDEEALIPFLQRLGERHAEYELTEADYRAASDTLVKVLSEVAGGETWTDEYETAWNEAMETVSKVMYESFFSGISPVGNHVFPRNW